MIFASAKIQEPAFAKRFFKLSHIVQGRFESHPSSFIAGIVPCAVFCAWTQPHGEMPPKDGTPVSHGCHAVAFLGAPAPRHGNPHQAYISRKWLYRLGGLIETDIAVCETARSFRLSKRKH